MTIPDYANRTPHEILNQKVFFDSAGCAYRGLSWLDYSKRHTDVQALQFAALSARFSIEAIIFETIIISVGGALDIKDYQKCKDSKKALYNVLKRLMPDYNKLLNFTTEILKMDKDAPDLITWDFDKLLGYWASISNYLHWKGSEIDTANSVDWFHKAIKKLDSALDYIWINLTTKQMGILAPSKMEPEVRQAWDEYRDGRIGLGEAKDRLRIAHPVMKIRKNLTIC